MTAPTKADPKLKVWVIDDRVDDGTIERLGDARQLADGLDGSVGALIVNGAVEAKSLIHHGADHVLALACPDAGVNTRVELAARRLASHPPRAVLASGTPAGREWAATLAVYCHWVLASPALVAECQGDDIEVQALSPSGARCRPIRVLADETVVMTVKPGVAEALPANPARTGVVEQLDATAVEEIAATRETIPADPATVDIRYAPRLVAGGRGLGSAAGFAALERLATRLGAGVAASRVAVDLGWIDRERQVGQTGKTVAPDLYIACGISGASHHLAGMSKAKHVVAINTDANAPIFANADLGLQADLHEVLREFEKAVAD